MKTLLGRALIGAVLLVAQQAALTHPIGDLHLGERNTPAFDASAAADGGPASRGELCQFHSTLGSVLGGAVSAAVLPVPPAAPNAAYPALLSSSTPLAPPPPASRDPPLYS